MNSPSERKPLTSIGALCRPGFLAALALLAGASSCVTEDAKTGERIPRGNQRYPWEKVKELAKGLVDGMSKEQVLMTMGSPAESTDDQWVYLPERYGILIPAEALRLEFKNGLLAEHGYRPIVLGARL